MTFNQLILNLYEKFIKREYFKIEEAENKVENSLQIYYDNKYPKVNILWSGRSLPFSKQKVSVPVSDLITPNNYRINKLLENWKFDLNEDFETLIPKIYNKIRTSYYKYTSDKLTWGQPDVWEFPFEAFYQIDRNKGLDCDSWAIFQTSFYLASGLPSWRVRCVAGNTPLGGHLTVYIFSFKDSSWHHLNSTYGRKYDNISSFPTTEDAGNLDNIGITNVWFSFNDLYSWHKFITKEDEKTFKTKKNKDKNIIIEKNK